MYTAQLLYVPDDVKAKAQRTPFGRLTSKDMMMAAHRVAAVNTLDVKLDDQLRMSTYRWVTIEQRGSRLVVIHLRRAAARERVSAELIYDGPLDPVWRDATPCADRPGWRVATFARLLQLRLPLANGEKNRA